MDRIQLNQLVSQAKEGNEVGRESLINHYKPYIINTVGHILNRYITWSDEESSIGLCAFNRAIDTYNSNHKRTFLNYVYLLIKRDLIDFYRKEKKQRSLSLDNNEQMKINNIEIKRSVEKHILSQDANALVEEILELEQCLLKYNISFEEIEDFSPKHRNTRVKIFKMAKEFIQNKELFNEFLKKKRIPIAEFINGTEYSYKLVERHRKYLIVIIIIYMHPEWTHLYSFTRITQNVGVLNGKQG